MFPHHSDDDERDNDVFAPHCKFSVCKFLPDKAMKRLERVCLSCSGIHNGGSVVCTHLRGIAR